MGPGGPENIIFWLVQNLHFEEIEPPSSRCKRTQMEVTFDSNMIILINKAG